MRKPVLKRLKLNILRGSHLSELPWLIQGFSTRPRGFSRIYGGNALNLGFTKDDSKALVERNRAEFLRGLGASTQRTNQRGAGSKLWPLVTLRQVHSDIIRFVDKAGEPQLVGDGIITKTPGVLLGIQTADCLPIILV